MYLNVKAVNDLCAQKMTKKITFLEKYLKKHFAYTSFTGWFHTSWAYR